MYANDRIDQQRSFVRVISIDRNILLAADEPVIGHPGDMTLKQFGNYTI